MARWRERARSTAPVYVSVVRSSSPMPSTASASRRAPRAVSSSSSRAGVCSSVKVLLIAVDK